jgi:KAP family P-loop domain
MERMSHKILLDNPSVNPVLGFEAYASALKEIIEVSDPQFSIGIFGGWGSGKTTLMRAIERQLNKEIVSVWFNAWRYEKEEHLIIPLLDVLRDALVAWATSTKISSSRRDRAIKAASTITKAARAIFAGTAIKAKLPLVEISLDANKAVAEWRDSTSAQDAQDAESPQSPYHASFKALQDSLNNFTERGKQRIVVFIDDLDRCLPSNALQVLESMKLFFDLEGFVFVVGLDQDVIEACVNWNYRFSGVSRDGNSWPPINGEDYIKKLFQVPFNLPAISRDQVGTYLTSIFPSGEGEDEDRDRLVELVRPHLDFLIGDSEANPREIKRFVNSYILQKLIQPDLDDDVGLVLQAITFRADWRVAYQVFRSERDAFIDAAKRQLNGEENALKDLSPRLADLPPSFFRYIGSSGWRKLLSLDASQLDEQVRTFEVTQTPETESDLAALADELGVLARGMRDSRPSDPGIGTNIMNLKRTLSNIHNRLQLMMGNSTQLARPETLRGAMDSIGLTENGVDALQFMMERSGDMQVEDFENSCRGDPRLFEI